MARHDTARERLELIDTHRALVERVTAKILAKQYLKVTVYPSLCQLGALNGENSSFYDSQEIRRYGACCGSIHPAEISIERPL